MLRKEHDVHVHTIQQWKKNSFVQNNRAKMISLTWRKVIMRKKLNQSFCSSERPR